MKERPLAAGLVLPVAPTPKTGRETPKVVSTKLRGMTIAQAVAADPELQRILHKAMMWRGRMRMGFHDERAASILFEFIDYLDANGLECGEYT